MASYNQESSVTVPIITYVHKQLTLNRTLAVSTRFIIALTVIPRKIFLTSTTINSYFIKDIWLNFLGETTLSASGLFRIYLTFLTETQLTVRLSFVRTFVRIFHTIVTFISTGR